MKEKRLSCKAVGKLVGMKHNSISYTLRKAQVKSDLLLKLSQALNHNFVALYVPELVEAHARIKELEKQVAEMETAMKNAQAQEAVAKRELEIWKEARGVTKR